MEVVVLCIFKFLNKYYEYFEGFLNQNIVKKLIIRLLVLCCYLELEKFEGELFFRSLRIQFIFF